MTFQLRTPATPLTVTTIAFSDETGDIFSFVVLGDLALLADARGLDLNDVALDLLVEHLVATSGAPFDRDSVDEAFNWDVTVTEANDVAWFPN